MDEQEQTGHQADRLSQLAGELKELAKVRHRRAVGPAELRQRIRKLPLLAALAGVGSEYDRSALKLLEQLVAAAVSRLASAAADPQDGDVQEADVDQLRCLLGMTPDTQWLSWPERQEKAAAVRYQAVGTFRREPRRALFLLLAEQLPEGPGTAVPARQKRLSDDLTIYPHLHAVVEPLIWYIWTEKPAAARMMLLSGMATHPILAALRGVECTIELLLCHPDSAVTEWQRRYITTSVEGMRSIGFQDYDRLSIQFYHTPASLHGWHIGDFAGVGWYTYRDKKGLAVDDPNQQGVYGHDNIVIVGDVRTERGDQLGTWFEHEYEELRQHRLTQPDLTLFPGDTA